MRAKYQDIAVKPIALLSELTERFANIQSARARYQDGLESIETLLSQSIVSMDTVNRRLKEARSRPAQAPAASTAARAIELPAGTQINELTANIEKMFQGSLEAATDKISDKLKELLNELKGLGGTAREAKINEIIKEAAASDAVDLSKLYLHTDAQSNLGDVGVEEKESKGISSSLKRLRELRRLKQTPGDKPEENKG